MSTLRNEEVARCVWLHSTLSVARTNQAIRYEMVAEVYISAILNVQQDFSGGAPSDGLLFLRSPFFVNPFIQGFDVDLLASLPW